MRMCDYLMENSPTQSASMRATVKRLIGEIDLIAQAYLGPLLIV